MCGIAGVIGGDARRLGPMLARLGHRGPDATATAVGGTAVLGCTRLAIRGGAAGDQPLRTRRGHLVFNGEIYNTAELAKELDWHGARDVDPASDTAVVGGLLDVLGIKAVDKLNGMFALAFDDGAEVWLARDPTGVKPLYYTDAAFCSEIAPLLSDAPAPDDGALARWLTFHFPYGTQTLFRGVRRVPPGGIVRLAEGATVRAGDPALRFSTPNPALTAERVRKVLERAVRDALPGEPYGVALSGGLDSTLVAALADDRATAYHGRVDAEGCDESSYARAAADALGIPLVEVEITAEACLAALPDVVRRLEEPVAGPGSLAQYIVARRAARDVRVLLSGCGGDELFGGYARHAALAFDEPPAGLESYAPLFERTRGLDAGERAFAGLDRRPGPFTDDFLAAHPAPRAEFVEAFHEGGLGPLAAASRTELAVTLPALLQVDDRTTMAFSLEGRVPLLDRRLLRVAARLSEEQRMDGDGRLKALLRDAAAPHLPEAVRARRDKMGFPLPLGDWLRGSWRATVRDVLLDRRTRERGLVDPARVERSLGEAGRYDRGLYSALLLETWFRTFIDSTS
jgi:asparagine synthase (glutamine-hydrolysing)